MEPYLVTVIKVIAELEAKPSLTYDDTYQLNSHRRWLAQHYPAVSAALAREYLSLASRTGDRAST